MLRRDLPQPRKIAWRQAGWVPRCPPPGSTEVACDLSRMGGEGCVDGEEAFVIGERERVLRRLRRDTCQAGDAER